ncbi:vWA domain-containing protein [Roseiflexus castenholzii]|uniref:vWA domain-containing protein n=1 Tax=Roseiflexus castenholzii TaxID=120962 RepID=UPI003C7E0B0C
MGGSLGVSEQEREAILHRIGEMLGMEGVPPDVINAIQDAIRRGDFQEAQSLIALSRDDEGDLFGEGIDPLMYDLPKALRSGFSSFIDPTIGKGTSERDRIDAPPDYDREQERPPTIAVAPKVSPEMKSALETLVQQVRTPEVYEKLDDLINTAIVQMASDFRVLDDKKVRNAIEEADQSYADKEAFLVSWGVGPGDLRLIPPIRFGTIAAYLENSPAINKIAKIAGRMAEALIAVIQKPKATEEPDYGHLGPIDFTDDPMAVMMISPEAFASSVMARQDPKYRPWSDFEMARISRRDYLGMLPRGKNEKRGGFVCAVDASGSMTAQIDLSGCPDALKSDLSPPVTHEDVAKATALALASVAAKLGHPFALILFSDSVSPHMRVIFNQEQVRSLTPDKRMDVIEKCLEWASLSIGGGTSFDSAVTAIIESIQEMDVNEIDGIMVTDGECSLSNRVVQAWKKQTSDRGTNMVSMIIGSESTGDIEAISQSVVHVRRMGDFFSEIISFGEKVGGTTVRPKRNARKFRISAF